MVRVAIIEDHTAIAEGLAALLAADGIEVVGIARNLEGAFDLIAATRPDVVLCDIMLDGRDAGLELLGRAGDVAPFLMFSAYDYPAHHARAIEAGARGYVSKTVDAERLLSTIRAVAAGGSAFGPTVVSSAAHALRRPTAREAELLTLLAHGATNDELAAALAISVKTVEGMFRRMFDRYGVSNRTQLLRLASTQGWLTSGPAAIPEAGVSPAAR